MKRIIGMLGLMALISLNGCATESFVRSQVDPLAERLGALEKKVSALEARPTGALSDADRMTISQAEAKAQKALDGINKLASEVKRADQDADRAEAAAKRAEAAAQQAMKEEKKSEKLFKLEQKK